MLAVAPQDCRTATEGAPEPSVLLGAAVAVRGRCMGPAVEPCFVVKGRVRRHVAAAARSGYQATASGNQVGTRMVRRDGPGFDPWLFAGVGWGAAPRRAGGGGLEPGYRVDAPPASREATDANACPAGTPQCRAVSCAST
jgi:hypothetical protein